MILVTGATGFIGGRLRQPHHRVLVRQPMGLPNEVVGDLLQPETLSQACAGVTTVIHCAGLSDADETSHDRLWAVNVTGTRNLLRAAAAQGVRRFVLLSSVKAAGEPGTVCADERWDAPPTTPYGHSKREAERLAWRIGGQSGMEVVVLRPAPVYGRGGKGLLATLVRLAARGILPPLPVVETNRRSFVHIADLVAAIHLAAAHPEAAGKTMIVAHPEPCSTALLLTTIDQALGRSRARWRLPAGTACWLTKIPGRLGRLASRLVSSACYTPATLMALGWQPQVDLLTGLEEMVGKRDVPIPADSYL